MPRRCSEDTKSRVCRYWYPFEFRRIDSRNALLMSDCLSIIPTLKNTGFIYSNFIVNFVQCRFHLSIFITEVTLCFLWGCRLEDICKCFWSPTQLHRLSVAGLRRSPASGGSVPQLRWSLSGGGHRCAPALLPPPALRVSSPLPILAPFPPEHS